MYIVYVSSGDISFLHIWSLLVLFVYLKRAGDKGDSFEARFHVVKFHSETDHAALVMTPGLNRYSSVLFMSALMRVIHLGFGNQPARSFQKQTNFQNAT